MRYKSNSSDLSTKLWYFYHYSAKIKWFLAFKWRIIVDIEPTSLGTQGDVHRSSPNSRIKSTSKRIRDAKDEIIVKIGDHQGAIDPNSSFETSIDWEMIYGNVIIITMEKNIPNTLHICNSILHDTILHKTAGKLPPTKK